MSRTESIRPASEEEISRIWEEEETFLVRRSGFNKSNVHLRSENGERRCFESWELEFEVREVTPASHPPTHFDVCRACVANWRAENEGKELDHE